MPEEPQIHPGYGALRIGRWSHFGCDYFITACLDRPQTGLTTEPLAGMLQTKLRELETAGHWKLRTFVLMPDHLHLLLTLGPDTKLSEAMRLFKGPLTPVLRACGLRWQKNFYDHRLRSVDELLPTFRYIFLNPHRAGLITMSEKWLGYYCSPEDSEWFSGTTNDSLPFPEWLQ